MQKHVPGLQNLNWNQVIHCCLHQRQDIRPSEYTDRRLEEDTLGKQVINSEYVGTEMIPNKMILNLGG